MILVGREKSYRVYGETLDIPLGNLFDTFTREIGIAPPYVSGGKHALDLCSEWGSEFIPLPYVVKGNDLSFSGLLTAALQLARREGRADKKRLGDICLSLRETAFNMLVEVVERGDPLYCGSVRAWPGALYKGGGYNSPVPLLTFGETTNICEPCGRACGDR